MAGLLWLVWADLGLPSTRCRGSALGKSARGWLIALMVLCCDPLAIALITVVSARRSITSTFGPQHIR